MRGTTTIEFWRKRNHENFKHKRYDFSREDISENLYQVFGTKNMFWIFMPSWKKLPTDGVSWDYNYDEVTQEDNELDIEM